MEHDWDTLMAKKLEIITPTCGNRIADNQN